jgi:DNA ligase-1
VRLPNGTDFAIGTGFSDRERENPPAIGATVTFRYQELSDAGVPRFPSWVGLRLDAPPVKPTSQARSAQHSTAPAPAAAPTSSAAASSPGPSNAGTKLRYFEFSNDTSNKFWEISQSGNSLTTRWGRIGTTGQNKTKTFADEKAAANAVAKLMEQKTGDGYVERDR